MGGADLNVHLDLPVRHSVGMLEFCWNFSRMAQRPRGGIITPRELIEKNKGVQSHGPSALPRRGLDEGAVETEK